MVPRFRSESTSAAFPVALASADAEPFPEVRGSPLLVPAPQLGTEVLVFPATDEVLQLEAATAADVTGSGNEAVVLVLSPQTGTHVLALCSTDTAAVLDATVLLGAHDKETAFSKETLGPAVLSPLPVTPVPQLLGIEVHEACSTAGAVVAYVTDCSSVAPEPFSS